MRNRAEEDIADIWKALVAVLCLLMAGMAIYTIFVFIQYIFS